MSDPVPVGLLHSCGGPIYFERCMDQNNTTHEWAVASECHRCGERISHTCPDCGATDRHGGSPMGGDAEVDQ